MIRIIKPPPRTRVTLYLFYRGDRTRFQYYEPIVQESTFTLHDRERKDNFFARMNVKLYDDKRIVLGLDCGQIYAGTSSIARDLPVLDGNCHIEEITVNDDLVFLKGFIHVEVPIADEVILDSYDFKVLAKSKLLAEYAIVSGHYYVTN